MTDGADGVAGQRVVVPTRRAPPRDERECGILGAFARLLPRRKVSKNGAAAWPPGRRTSGWGLAVVVAAASILLAAAAEEEEEQKATPVACSISVMLLGNIGFQMLLFYLVHHPDEDIKRYSWQVISSTISIFCAVLLFQACNGLVEEHLIEGMEKSALVEFLVSNIGKGCWPLAVDLMQLFVWLFLLQLVLAKTSGAIGEPPAGGLEEVELLMRSYSVLFAHITSFASINAWGYIQQEFFKDSAAAILAVPIGLVGLFGLYFVFDHIREMVAMGDDGRIDVYEERWDEETEEAENDVAGLSLSFLTVQVLRYVISGVFPNQEGVEPWNKEVSHATWHWVALLSCGAIFMICSVVVLEVTDRIPEKNARWIRAAKIANNFFTFGSAWCFLYSCKWALSSLQLTQENALLHVVIALFLSGVSFMCIFFLDKIEDAELLGIESEAAIDLAIEGLGILVGCSWEQCFDVAFAVVAESLKGRCPPSLSRPSMSVLLVLIVFPAWRIYILKTEQELIEETTEKAEQKMLEQHSSYFMDEGEDETVLDFAHLKMKNQTS